MAPGSRRIAADFRLREFALRAFESVSLRAVGGGLPACQFHSCPTHGAARRLDRLGGRRREFVRRRHDFFPYDRDLRLAFRIGDSPVKACLRPSLRGALATKQSSFLCRFTKLDCFAALAMTAYMRANLLRRLNPFRRTPPQRVAMLGAEETEMADLGGADIGGR